MQKNKILVLILILFVTFIGKVNAEEEVDKTCNAVSINELRTQAANVKISYVEEVEMRDYFDGNDGTNAPSPVDVLKVKIYNITSNLYITYEITGANVKPEENKTEVLTLDRVGSDGAITLKQDGIDEIITYTFQIKSDEYGCAGRTLRTVRLTLPRFNYYSNLTVCKDIPEYYLCKKFVTFDNSNNPDFMEKVTEYKATLEKQREEGDDDDENIISETLTNVSKYKYVVVGVIVAIGVVITVLVLRRKRSDK